MRNRRWRWTAALGAVTLVATACIGGGGQTQQQAQPVERVEPPTEETTITFSSWIGESPEIKQLVKDFEEEYPTITVELQNVPAERSREKLLTQVAGGNPPDSAYVDLSVVEDFGTRGALVNLDNYIAQS
ncbi:MAG TPA: extracellular solute-binding protein, partial [Actinomycetota bacterium]|nr:extracellular solute-binding protein [Actinomycetota bacterium]